MPETTRQLAAIMFTDIVGYTALMGQDEEKAFQLLDKNLSIQKPLIEKHNGKLLKEIGDGIMASFISVIDAVECAKEIQYSLKDDQEHNLRLGIHLGEVTFKDDDVFGDGVNIASRIQELANPGELLVSETVYKNIKNHPDIDVEFVREEKLKNVDDLIRIYKIKIEDGYVSKPLPHIKESQPTEPGKPKRKNKVLLTTIAAIVILALAYFIYNNQIKNDEVVDEIEKSIAVLPFIDLTESKNQGWFADGLTLEIRNSLAHVDGLHVISRTSSFTFKNKNLRIQTIADSLQVNYIVEGSVRKSDQGMRIRAQLIRAKDDFQIWSNTYDRNSKDIFVVQQDIASNIARSLDISLDPKAIEQMQWAGTKNADAYIAFLKGRELDDESHRADEFIDLAMLEKANTYYEESIKLDPYFLNAYLYHADFFLHYILNDDPRYQSTLTESEAYKMFMDDLGNTISRSKDESQKNYFRIARIMHSSDWTNFREVIEKSLNSPDAVKNFTYQNFGIRSVIIILGYGNQFSAIHNKILENDPSGIATRGIVANLIYWGKYNEALQEISKNEGSIQLKIYSLYQLGKMDEAYDLISKMESSGTNYYSLKAMILVKKGRNQEAKEIMSVEHERGGFYLMAIDAVFGRQAANKEANLLDQKALLDFPLFVGIAYSPNNPPFDFSATPNFARRLKQAGIEINSK